MIDFIAAIVATIAMARFAETDRGEGLKWGAITFGLCLLSFLIPLPLLRIMIACGVSFVLMTVMKKTYY